MNFDLYQVGREYAAESTKPNDIFIPKALRAAAKTVAGAESLEAGIAGVPVWDRQRPNVREGTMLILGCPFHVILIRVDEDGDAINDAYQFHIDAIRGLDDCCSSDTHRLVDDHWFPVITPFLA